MPKTKSGFTLIELLIAISIIAIISAVGIIAYSKAQVLARDARRKQDLQQIAKAFELFYNDNKRYPCTGGWVNTVGLGVWIVDSNVNPCTGSGNNIAPIYITQLPKDPINVAPLNYGYISPGIASGTGAGSCPAGQHYALATYLENTADPQRLEVNPKSLCNNGFTFAVPPYSPNLYLITVP